MLSQEDLVRLVPAAFAESRDAQRTSDRYNFISTRSVIDTVIGTGWQPFRAMAVNKRKGNAEHAKHMIVFRQSEGMLRVGDTVPELLLTNAHDGSSAFVFMLGLFRLICSNGLVVSDGVFESFRVRHNAGTLTNVVDVVAETVERLPRVQETVLALQKITLTDAERRIYAESAVKLRWDDVEVTPDTVEHIVHPVRNSDMAPTLWNTYNTAQERLVGRSGTRLTVRTDKGESRRRKVRAVRGLNDGISLNKSLFHLTVEMAKLKGVSI